MAFPGTYNINYYKGDTYEFAVYPKTTEGGTFLMTDYTSAKFTIATARGTGALSTESYASTLTAGEKRVVLTTGDTSKLKVGQRLYKITGTGTFAADTIITYISNSTTFLVQDAHGVSGTINFKANNSFVAEAEISADGKSVLCAITPEIANYLDAATPYVYDIQIFKDSTPYPYTYTLLTGSLSLTEDITLAGSAVPAITAVPGQVRDLAVTPASVTDDAVTVTWAAPNTGGAVAAYFVGYIKNPTGTPADVIVPILTPLLPTATSYTFTGLDAATPYALGVLGQNVVGFGEYSIVAALTDAGA